MSKGKGSNVGYRHQEPYCWYQKIQVFSLQRIEILLDM